MADAGLLADPMLSVEDFAALLNVDRQVIYNLNFSGEGPPRYRIGKQLRYKRSEVMAFIESRRVEPAPAR
jgi:excisionase family DNA binding protein